jgi:hypothetical protein
VLPLHHAGQLYGSIHPQHTSETTKLCEGCLLAVLGSAVDLQAAAQRADAARAAVPEVINVWDLPWNRALLGRF